MSRKRPSRTPTPCAACRSISATGSIAGQAASLLTGIDLDGLQDAVAEVLVKLYDVYRTRDAELLEINPLVLTRDGRVIALDCKFTLDDSADRPPAARSSGTARRTSRPIWKPEAAAAGLKYIELGGSVGVLANGAGLTMTTMDAITHYGGTPSNFLEIGGEAYTKSETRCASC